MIPWYLIFLYFLCKGNKLPELVLIFGSVVFELVNLLEVIALYSIKPICPTETDFSMRSLWVHIDCLGTNVRDKFR